MLCRDTKPNFPGCDDAPATTTPRGSKRAEKCASDTRLREGAVTAVDSSEISISASTATIEPFACTISGFTSTETIRWSLIMQRPTAINAATSSSIDTALSPRKSFNNFCNRRLPTIDRASCSVIGNGLKTTSSITSAITPPTPSIKVAPNTGSRSAPIISSRLPDTIGATNSDTDPSSGVAAASSSSAARATSLEFERRKRTSPRSVL